jgi:hypothetical protein
MKRYLLCFLVTCFSTVCGVNFSILIKNETKDQCFEVIRTTEAQGSTLHQDTNVSDVWYGANQVGNAVKIAPKKSIRLFVSVNPETHNSGSDYFCLKNCHGEFYIHLGRTTEKVPLPLPVVSQDADSVNADTVPILGKECISSSGAYKAIHLNRRSEGGDVISVSRLAF